MKSVRAVYEDGVVQLLEDPKVKGKVEVKVVFPEKGDLDLKEIEIRGVDNDPADLRPLCGFVSLGGDSLEDTEALYDE